MYIKYQPFYHLWGGVVVERRANCLILVSLRFQVVLVQTSQLHYFVSPIFYLFSFFFLSSFLLLLLLLLLFRFDFCTSFMSPPFFVTGFYFHYSRMHMKISVCRPTIVFSVAGGKL